MRFHRKNAFSLKIRDRKFFICPGDLKLQLSCRNFRNFKDYLCSSLYCLIVLIDVASV